MHFSLAFFWFRHSLHAYIYLKVSFRPHLDLIWAKSKALESAVLYKAYFELEALPL